jgi:hypothetical protein
MALAETPAKADHSRLSIDAQDQVVIQLTHREVKDSAGLFSITGALSGTIQAVIVKAGVSVSPATAITWMLTTFASILTSNVLTGADAGNGVKIVWKDNPLRYFPGVMNIPVPFILPLSPDDEAKLGFDDGYSDAQNGDKTHQPSLYDTKSYSEAYNDGFFIATQAKSPSFLSSGNGYDDNDDGYVDGHHPGPPENGSPNPGSGVGSGLNSGSGSDSGIDPGSGSDSSSDPDPGSGGSSDPDLGSGGSSDPGEDPGPGVDPDTQDWGQLVLDPGPYFRGDFSGDFGDNGGS